MTITELQTLCEQAESKAQDKANAGFAVKVPRKARGEYMKVVPGLTGRVVDCGQYNDGTWLSVVWLECRKVRKALTKLQEDLWQQPIKTAREHQITHCPSGDADDC